MKKIIIKLQSTFLILILIAMQVIPGSVIAQEITAPEAPETPVVSAEAPTNPAPPEAPTAPSSPVSNDSSQNNYAQDKPADANNTGSNNESNSKGPDSDREAKKKAAEEAFIANYNNQNNNSGTSPAPSTGVTSNGNNGDTTIATGNTNNTGNISTGANNNVSTSPSPVTANNQASASVTNSSNGTGTTNNAVTDSTSSNILDQNNSAQVKSNLQQTSVTGINQSSFNNGDTTLSTGDSNVTGTIMTAVNTNVDGVMVSEFNVADDHKGDIVLTPEAYLANCISGCGGTTTIANSGNGVNSQNTASASSQNENATFQNNDATVGNSLTLSANSGDNSSNFNTGGNTVITTGDANVSANALNFVNNNISGNVAFGVVNIYGIFEGDIILPDYTITSLGSGLNAQNTGNGALSESTASASTANANSTTQNNDATIANNLILDGQTGNNSSGFNTNGDTTVKTGQTNAQANVLNVANTNTQNAPVWLVLINEAGKWLGQLLGVPEGQNFAGSDGTRFEISPEGQINASNNANGAESSNNISATQTNNNNTVQNNTADINNTLNLTANTGGNTSDFNTGGNNVISTGNSNIIANIINFTNNNISGKNPLIVMVVNVFDKWLGDFVAPGQQKREKNENKQEEIINVQNEILADEEYATTPNQQVLNSQTGILAGIAAPQQPRKVNISILSSYQEHTTTVYSGGPAEEIKVVSAGTFQKDKLLANASMLNSNEETALKTKAIKINLAWIVLIIPLIAMYFIGKIILKNKIIYLFKHN